MILLCKILCKYCSISTIIEIQVLFKQNFRFLAQLLKILEIVGGEQGCYVHFEEEEDIISYRSGKMHRYIIYIKFNTSSSIGKDIGNSVGGAVVMMKTTSSSDRGSGRRPFFQL